MNPPRRIALYGGGFDPVHIGHLGVIDFLRAELGFPQVWVLPSGTSPSKRFQAADEHRLACLRVAIGTKRPEVRIETHELETPGPHFTTNTLSHFGLPKDEVTFVIGSDQFTNLHHWKNFPHFLDQCQWIVLQRDGGNERAFEDRKAQFILEGVLKPLGRSTVPPGAKENFETRGGTRLTTYSVRVPRASSVQIRREIALEGVLSRPEVLPPGVDQYLKQHQLYGRVP